MCDGLFVHHIGFARYARRMVEDFFVRQEDGVAVCDKLLRERDMIEPQHDREQDTQCRDFSNYAK